MIDLRVAIWQDGRAIGRAGWQSHFVGEKVFPMSPDGWLAAREFGLTMAVSEDNVAREYPYTYHPPKIWVDDKPQ